MRKSVGCRGRRGQTRVRRREKKVLRKEKAGKEPGGQAAPRAGGDGKGKVQGEWPRGGRLR